MKYLLFITFFPRFCRGRFPDMKNWESSFIRGMILIRRICQGGLSASLGIFQKMVIADRCNLVVNQIFRDYQSYDGIYFWIAGILYSLQLYTDFAGCVSIAAGSAQMLGIKLPQNFNHPYLAVSIRDFWRRWHISLSSFLRDYVYIPMGGNRKGKLCKWFYIMVTFLSTASGMESAPTF